MTGIEMVQNAGKFIDRLSDEMSRKLYEARAAYAIYHDLDKLYDEILDIGFEWNIFEMNGMKGIMGEIESIVIFGAGRNGKHTYRLIKQSKYKDIPIRFCDNNSSLWGADDGFGSEIISPHILRNSYAKSLVVIGSSKHRKGIFEQLLFEDHCRDRILYPELGILFGATGHQYFDFLKPLEDEVFIDAGCFDGFTSIEFARWCNNKYEKIYAFEANPYCVDRCKENLRRHNVLRTDLVEAAVWNQIGTIEFESNYSGGAHVSESGNVVVKTDTIDHVLDGKKATFIKMDVEGAELNALIGAEKTIKKHKPRLAISIYHKPEDIFEIPSLLMDYCPDYKFALRQYQSNASETILYAFSSS